MAKNIIVSFISNSPDSLIQQYKDLPDPPIIKALGTRSQVKETEALEGLKEATLVITSPPSPYLSRKMLQACTNVKFIQFTAVGYDNIDLEAATELGIPVANNPGWNSISVAEHTLMLILVTLKKVKYGRNKLLSSGFSMPELIGFWNQVNELNGKTVGIIGFGAIGGELLKLLKPFNVKVLYNKRNRLSADYEEILGVEFRDLSSLLSESDVVSVHTPLTDETRHLFNRSTLKMMKKGSILINTARQEIVDEDAVADALDEGVLGGYGTDFIKKKRVDGLIFLDSKLVDSDYVVFTPVGGGTRESLTRCRIQYLENVRRFLVGEEPNYIINKPKKPNP